MIIIAKRIDDEPWYFETVPENTCVIDVMRFGECESIIDGEFIIYIDTVYLNYMAVGKLKNRLICSIEGTDITTLDNLYNKYFPQREDSSFSE